MKRRETLGARGAYVWEPQGAYAPRSGAERDYATTLRLLPVVLELLLLELLVGFVASCEISCWIDSPWLLPPPP